MSKMIHMTGLILAMVLVLVGCDKTTQSPAETDKNKAKAASTQQAETGKPVSDNNKAASQQAGKTDKPKLEERVGKMSLGMMQHPIIVDGQSYFMIDNDGEIIIVFAEGVEKPAGDRKVKIYGGARPVNLGGKPGTKMSYGGEVFTVTKWEYIDE